MKISFPTNGTNGLNETLGQHFGRVPTYTILDTENEELRVIENRSTHGGGAKYPPELLAEEEIDIMVCRGLGRRAVQMFEEFGIEVYIGAEGTVEDAYEQYRSGSLQMATDENACREHAFRKHEH